MTGFESEGRRLASLIALVFGGLMHVVVGVFVLSSGLVAPAWAAAVLSILWVTAAWLLWRWRHAPVRVLFVPVVMAAFWWAAITAGDAWLGWSA